MREFAWHLVGFVFLLVVPPHVVGASRGGVVVAQPAVDSVVTHSVSFPHMVLEAVPSPVLPWAVGTLQRLRDVGAFRSVLPSTVGIFHARHSAS
jgi:hypothetical protein